ncbi:hypothetical protein PROFUN_05921 [Planoprotostelium fungivorum]|uniref:Uncharacterized protein n=1 Tax=Planoprotostelium fungivorum TaxID=1890364 RepID=A0A2P6N7M1_9EUKA|nr:hypothetical protein PROFUN_05921 [Planoprotostelium fungivorum]
MGETKMAVQVMENLLINHHTVAALSSTTSNTPYNIMKKLKKEVATKALLLKVTLIMSEDTSAMSIEDLVNTTAFLSVIAVYASKLPPSRWSHVVYNSSIHLWKICGHLLNQTPPLGQNNGAGDPVRMQLLPYVEAVIKSLEETNDSDIEWRVKLLAILCRLQEEGKCREKATRTIQQAWNLLTSHPNPPNIALSIREEVLRMRLSLTHWTSPSHDWTKVRTEAPLNGIHFESHHLKAVMLCQLVNIGAVPKSKVLADLREAHTIAAANFEASPPNKPDPQLPVLLADLLVEVGQSIVNHLVGSQTFNIAVMGTSQTSQFVSDLNLAATCAEGILLTHRYPNLRCRINAELLSSQMIVHTIHQLQPTVVECHTSYEDPTVYITNLRSKHAINTNDEFSVETPRYTNKHTRFGTRIKCLAQMMRTLNLAFKNAAETGEEKQRMEVISLNICYLMWNVTIPVINRGQYTAVLKPLRKIEEVITSLSISATERFQTETSQFATLVLFVLAVAEYEAEENYLKSQKDMNKCGKLNASESFRTIHIDPWKMKIQARLTLQKDLDSDEAECQQLIEKAADIQKGKGLTQHEKRRLGLEFSDQALQEELLRQAFELLKEIEREDGSLEYWEARDRGMLWGQIAIGSRECGSEELFGMASEHFLSLNWFAEEYTKGNMTTREPQPSKKYKEDPVMICLMARIHYERGQSLLEACVDDHSNQSQQNRSQALNAFISCAKLGVEFKREEFIIAGISSVCNALNPDSYCFTSRKFEEGSDEIVKEKSLGDGAHFNHIEQLDDCYNIINHSQPLLLPSSSVQSLFNSCVILVLCTLLASGLEAQGRGKRRSNLSAKKLNVTRKESSIAHADSLPPPTPGEHRQCEEVCRFGLTIPFHSHGSGLPQKKILLKIASRMALQRGQALQYVSTFNILPSNVPELQCLSLLEQARHLNDNESKKREWTSKAADLLSNNNNAKKVAQLYPLLPLSSASSLMWELHILVALECVEQRLYPQARSLAQKIADTAPFMENWFEQYGKGDQLHHISVIYLWISIAFGMLGQLSESQPPSNEHIMESRFKSMGHYRSALRYAGRAPHLHRPGLVYNACCMIWNAIRIFSPYPSTRKIVLAPLQEIVQELKVIEDRHWSFRVEVYNHLLVCYRDMKMYKEGARESAEAFRVIQSPFGYPLWRHRIYFTKRINEPTSFSFMLKGVDLSETSIESARASNTVEEKNSFYTKAVENSSDKSQRHLSHALEYSNWLCNGSLKSNHRFEKRQQEARDLLKRIVSTFISRKNTRPSVDEPFEPSELLGLARALTSLSKMSVKSRYEYAILAQSMYVRLWATIFSTLTTTSRIPADIQWIDATLLEHIKRHHDGKSPSTYGITDVERTVEDITSLLELLQEGQFILECLPLLYLVCYLEPDNTIMHHWAALQLQRILRESNLDVESTRVQTYLQSLLHNGSIHPDVKAASKAEIKRRETLNMLEECTSTQGSDGDQQGIIPTRVKLLLLANEMTKVENTKEVLHEVFRHCDVYYDESTRFKAIVCNASLNRGEDVIELALKISQHPTSTRDIRVWYTSVGVIIHQLAEKNQYNEATDLATHAVQILCNIAKQKRTSAYNIATIYATDVATILFKCINQAGEDVESSTSNVQRAISLGDELMDQAKLSKGSYGQFLLWYARTCRHLSNILEKKSNCDNREIYLRKCIASLELAEEFLTTFATQLSIPSGESILRTNVFLPIMELWTLVESELAVSRMELHSRQKKFVQNEQKKGTVEFLLDNEKIKEALGDYDPIMIPCSAAITSVDLPTHLQPQIFNVVARTWLYVSTDFGRENPFTNNGQTTKPDNPWLSDQVTRLLTRSLDLNLALEDVVTEECKIKACSLMLDNLSRSMDEHKSYKLAVTQYMCLLQDFLHQSVLRSRAESQWKKISNITSVEECLRLCPKSFHFVVIQFSANQEKIYLSSFNNDFSDVHCISLPPNAVQRFHALIATQKSMLFKIKMSTRQEAENICRKIISELESLMQPLTSHMASYTKNHFVLFVDSMLCDLPFESLFVFENAPSVSRDFSLHNFAHRLRDPRNKSHALRRKINYVIEHWKERDPLNNFSDAFTKVLSSKIMKKDTRDKTPKVAYEGYAGDRSATSEEMQEALKSSLLLYWGDEDLQRAKCLQDPECNVIVAFYGGKMMKQHQSVASARWVGATTFVCNQWDDIHSKTLFDFMDDLGAGRAISDCVQSTRRAQSLIERWNIVVYGLPLFFLNGK